MLDVVLFLFVLYEFACAFVLARVLQLWWHATLNIGEAVGMAGQRRNAESEFYVLEKKVLSMETIGPPRDCCWGNL